jgi:hypothetical protein
MRWFGHTFSKKYFLQLQRQPVDAPFPQGSFEFEEPTFDGDDKEYDAFFSYRGGSGRIPLWIALCGQFNLIPPFIFLFAIVPLIAIGMSFIPDPCANYSSARDWYLFSDACRRLPDERSWFIFRAYCPPIVVILVLFWHPLFSWFYRNDRYFLDKFC